jgi:hypothetical protein
MHRCSAAPVARTSSLRFRSGATVATTTQPVPSQSGHAARLLSQIAAAQWMQTTCDPSSP